MSWQRNHRSGYDAQGYWRQVLNWKDAHLVDHGGDLWIWQTGQDEEGYRLIHPRDEPVLYDLNDLYD